LDPVERLRRAVARLLSRQRAVVVRRIFQVLPHKEIEGIVGSTVDAVKVNVFHAMGNLRRLLGPDKSGCLGRKVGKNAS